MGYRGQVSNGQGWGLHGDKTSTGAECIATKSDYSDCGKWVLQVGDQTTPCPKCGKVGVIATGDDTFTGMGGNPLAYDGSIITCGCPDGSHFLLAPAGVWIGGGEDPKEIARKAWVAERKIVQEAEEKLLAEERDRNRVFAKSCLRGEGCNDAGEDQELHTNFAEMAFFWQFHLLILHQRMMWSSTPRLQRKRNLLKIFLSLRSEAPCING